MSGQILHIKPPGAPFLPSDACSLLTNFHEWEVRKQQLQYQCPIKLFSNTALACGFICENSIAEKNHRKFG